MSCNSKQNDLTKREEDDTMHNEMKTYYGKVVKSQADFKVSICPDHRAVPRHIQEAIDSAHEEVKKRYLGCGLVITEMLEGASVLDLGSGSGRDCFAISKLVGENGHVTGVDMTDEQIQFSNSYIQYHTDKFGYQKPNVNFVQGYIEKLDEVGLQNETFDIVTSNCVICLSPDKVSTFREAYRVLKPGGEMFFSDICADRDLPDSVRKLKVLWGEGIAGSLWWEQLYDIAQEIGFTTPRLVSATNVPVERNEFKKLLGDAKFFSATCRLFRLPHGIEKHPARATYTGGIIGAAEELLFDQEYTFQAGKPVLVDEELAAILKHSRFRKHFTLVEDDSAPRKQVTKVTLPDVVSSTDSSIEL